MKTPTLLLVLALVLAVPAPGQAPSREIPRVTGSVEVSLHNLDVVVVDGAGNPVHGLTAADFELLHDGKPARITNFREEAPTFTPVPPAASPAPGPSPAPSATPPEAAPASAQPPSAEAARSRRHVVVFVDRLSLPDPVDRKNLFQGLAELLKRGLAPGDQAMIVSWDRSIRTVHPFTSDQKELEKALDLVSGGALRVAPELAELERLYANDEWFALMGIGDSSMSRELDAMQSYQDVKGKVAALRGLISMMAGMDGRKAIVVVARRLSRRAGAEYGSVGIDTRSLVDSVTSDANAAGVTLHTIYSTASEFELPSAAASRAMSPTFTGPRTSPRVQNNWQNEMASLASLAEKTGGVVVGSLAESGTFAERVARDLDSWYSIGYPVPEGAARSADVSVKVRRPGVTVRVRRSVVAKPPEEQMSDRVLANLFRPDEHATLPIAVTLKTPRRTGKGIVWPFEIRVPVDRLLLRQGPKGREGAVSIFAVSAGPAGDFSEVKRLRKTIRLEGDSAAPGHLAYEIEVETRTASARISIGVWDEVGMDAGFRIASFR